MLIKEELRGIPLLPVPSVQTQTHRADYLTAVDRVELKRSGEVLVADIYHAKDESLYARFFSDGKGYYTCNSWPDGAFGKSNPAHGWWGMVDSISYEEDTALAEIFLGKSRKDSWRSKGALAVIDAFISDCQQDKRFRAEERKEILRQQHFSMFPGLPENIEKYCDEQVFKHSYIFFDKLTKTGRRYARCGNCGKKYRVSKSINRNEKTTCPNCGAKAVYKAAWNPGKMEEKAKLCICHKVSGNLLIRWMDVKRYYTSDFVRKYGFSDYAYNLYIEDKHNRPTLYAYEYRAIPYYGTHEWKRCRNGSQNYSCSYVYTDNLDQVFGDNYYNVNLKQGLHGKQMEICVTSLLNNLQQEPAAEYLFKLGMPLLAANAEYITKSKNRKPGFSECLGISKQLLPMYSSMCVSVSEHLVIKKYGKWVSLEDLAEYRKLGVKYYDTVTVNELLKSMSMGKFVRYFGKQRSLSKRTIKFLMDQYKDYISMARSLKVDLSRKSNLYPADICAAHDLILDEFNRLKFEKENTDFKNAVAKVYPKLSVREWEDEKYCIVLPQLRTDLTAEGQSLRHCVGAERYCEAHMKGEKMIFFVRRKEQKGRPYFTMEVDMNTMRIIQLHGAGNCAAPRDVRKFAESFVRVLRLIDDETTGRKTA